MARPGFPLYLITDRHLCAARGVDLVDVVGRVCAALPPGSVAVQLREKELLGGELLALGLALRAVTLRHGASLLVNERVDVAILANADGVHLPRSALAPADVRAMWPAVWPAAIIGASTHTQLEVEDAARAGADFIVFGPVFDTPSKRDFGAPVGVEALRAAAAATGRVAERAPPVFALGGVDAGRAAALREAGAGGLACISAILGAVDPVGAARALLRAFEGARARAGA